jgi:hypothetical protein
VSLDRSDAQAQPAGDRLVRQALRHKIDHLELARAEAGDINGRTLPAARIEKRLNLRQEHRPRRLVLKQDVIGGFHQDETRVRNQRGQQPALLDRDHPVVPRVHHERGRSYPGCQFADVEAAPRTEEPGRGRGSRGSPEQILIPGHLLRGSVREEKRTEYSAEGRIRRLPARADRADYGVFLLALAPEPSSARISSVQREAGDAVRVACRIRDGDRCSLRYAKQRELL